MSRATVVAPPVVVPRGMEPKLLTMIYPFYENAEFFARQLGTWAAYPDALRSRVRVIVVDDCSPGTSAADVVAAHASRSRLPSIRVFRIGRDVRWNWLAARNVGAHHAEDGWLLLTDMDHVVTDGVLYSVLHGRHDPSVIYRFSRRERGAAIHPHPNSWLMTREMYWRVGGYDEDASGYYGTDGDYRRRCALTASVVVLADELERHEYETDSSTTRYLRKQPEDARGKQILRDKRRRGLPPKTLSFPYSEMRL